MAKIDLARRAQIGRDRRAKTRAQLMQAARALYAERTIESVTIDDVVNEAGVAKGTFYVHFEHLPDLQVAVADELAQELDDLLQPFRLQLADPIERIAAGCAAFIREAFGNPSWGSLAARSAWELPSVAHAARKNLREDLRLAAARGRLSGITPELGFDVVSGIVLQTMRAAGERRLSPSDATAAVEAILRALGVASAEAHSIVARVFETPKATMGALASG
ncbi:MAG TPA: TetR/AcrR family transcriptional regulator [Roseiarcus sp.]|jgi:AcrR family transcriptional regulator